MTKAVEVPEQMTNLALGLRGLAPLLQLTAYATDAMRVLGRLKAHASHHPAFENQARLACPDWHNPGAIHDPADLLTEVLFRVCADLQGLTHAMEAVLTSIDPQEPRNLSMEGQTASSKEEGREFN